MIKQKALRIRRKRIGFRAFVGVAAAIALVIIPVRIASNSHATSVEVSSGAVNAPPPEAVHKPRLWLSSQTIPTTGGDMVATIMNPSDRQITEGVNGVVRRWNGTRWIAAGHWYVALTEAGFGTITRGTESVLAVSVVVGPDTSGPGEYFMVRNLGTGWYQIGYPASGDMPALYGQFRVQERMRTPLAPISNSAVSGIAMSSVIVPTRGATVQVMGYASREGRATSALEQRFNDELASEITIERWVGPRWTKVGIAIKHPASSAIAGGASTITIPALRVGTYRLVDPKQHSNVVERVFWVVKDDN